MSIGIFHSDSMAIRKVGNGFDILISLESKSAAIRTRRGFRQVTATGPFPVFEKGERLPSNSSKNHYLSLAAGRYDIDIMPAFLDSGGFAYGVEMRSEENRSEIAAAFPERFRFLIENTTSSLVDDVMPLISECMMPDEVNAFIAAGKYLEFLNLDEPEGDEVEEAA